MLERSICDRKDDRDRQNPPDDGRNHLAGRRKVASSHKNCSWMNGFLIAGLALSSGVAQAQTGSGVSKEV
jgi:hypothetical protein